MRILGLRQARAGARGSHQHHRRRPGGRHRPPGVHHQPARGVRRRGRGPTRRAARRRGDRAHARAGRCRGAAAVRGVGRHAQRRAAADRPTATGIRSARRRRSSAPSASSSRPTAPFDLILFGNESADSGGFQVGIRVAHALGRPMVNGGKGSGDRRWRRPRAARGRRRPRDVRAAAAGSGRRQGRASTCRATRR